VQHTHRCSANRTCADDENAAPHEMLVPPMTPRMKQLRDAVRFRIDAGQVRTFVQITVDAGEREIVEFVTAAVKSRNDVLDVESSQRRIILMKLAILAAVAGAFPNGGSRRGIIAYDEPTISRACRCKTATNLFART
jgi:hypothetical protein